MGYTPYLVRWGPLNFPQELQDEQLSDFSKRLIFYNSTEYMTLAQTRLSNYKKCLFMVSNFTYHMQLTDWDLYVHPPAPENMSNQS